MEYINSYISTLFFSMSESLRYVFIFVISFFEGIPIIGSILPGGTIALLVGSLSASAFINPLGGSLLIALGTFMGDMTGFIIARHYKHHRYIKRLVSVEKHQKSWELFDRHIALVVIFGKLLPVVRSMPSLFAAARGIRIRKYVMYSFLGSILWAFAGIYGGNLLTKVFGKYAVPIILGVLVISAIAAVLKKKRKKNIQ